MFRVTAHTATGEIVAFDAEEGRKLVLALEDNGVDILHRCGGNAKCTTCRVEVVEGDPGEIGEAEKAVLIAKGGELTDYTRLSCQIRVISALTVKVARQTSVEGLEAGTRPTE